MAIPCNACSKPVHARTVICPHGCEHTGVVADPMFFGETAAVIGLARIEST